MTSAFSFKAIVVPILCVFGVAAGIIGFVMEEMLTEDVLPLWFSILFVAFMAFVFGWIFFGEFRTKVVRLELGDTELKVKGYGGLGRARSYAYKDLDGFRISLLPANTRDYEYLYILKSGKKICKISDFYHTNYYDLKAAILTKMPDLGTEDFSLATEIKESFS